MAWVRRVRTASGATAVQIAEYVEGRRRVVAHIGSAHTEAEPGVLVERARELLGEQTQGELDLGVEPTARRARLIAPADATEGRGAEKGLFTAASAADDEVKPGRVGAPQVVATGSRLLFDTLGAVFDGLGFDVVGDEAFRDLVIARIVEPTSIRDTGRVLTDLGVSPVSEKTLRRTLARCAEHGYRDRIAGGAAIRAS